MRPQDGIIKIKGIGEKTAQSFGRAGIATVEDLLLYFPRGYEEYKAPEPIASLKEGGPAVVCGALAGDARVRRAGRMQIVDAVIRDESGSLKATWFNMLYLRNALQAGRRYVFKGKLAVSRFGTTLEQPILYTPENYARLVGTMQPIYSLTGGLTGRMVGKAVQEALQALPELPEYLPAGLRREYRLAEYNYALRTIHFPPDATELTVARRRLVFDEFFLFILAVRYLRDTNETQPNGCRIEPSPEVERFIERLPFPMTGAQRRTYEEIRADLCGPKLMNRLVQGDVGSGKTIVALLALLQMALSGWQGVLMAPTEVLARQHYETVTRFLEQGGLSLRVELLTGSMTAKEKRLAYERIASHQADLVIGTHAVIQDKVRFARLGLVITDEQHRFGVRQRGQLAAKADHPHLLVMSATPIPRTLGLLMFGDLDISVLDELPPGRTPVKTYAVTGKKRADLYGFLRRQIAAGRQAYLVCPVIDEGESDMLAVTTYYSDVAQPLLAGCRVGLMHGRLKAAEKAAVMDDFKAGRLDALVSTTVIEVGVDVPNASCIVIENAERYGLSALHQLRGRVGRGGGEAYCVLVSDHVTDAVKKRLSFLCHTNDGFAIAKFDLETRGPGDFFGSRQHGLPTLRIADLAADSRVLYAAQQEALALIRDDPALRAPEHAGLRELAEGLFDGETALN